MSWKTLEENGILQYTPYEGFNWIRYDSVGFKSCQRKFATLANFDENKRGYPIDLWLQNFDLIDILRLLKVKYALFKKFDDEDRLELLDYSDGNYDGKFRNLSYSQYM